MAKENKDEETKPIGRPSKLTKKFLDAANEIISDDMKVLVCTDKELVFLINQKLKKRYRICEHSFENWKAKSKNSEENELPPNFKEFLGLIKKALVIQKETLMLRLQGEKFQWTKWAWIIERKFDEWNLKQKLANDPDNPISNNIIIKLPSNGREEIK